MTFEKAQSAHRGILRCFVTDLGIFVSWPFRPEYAAPACSHPVFSVLADTKAD